MKRFFEQCLNNITVLESHIGLRAKNLQKNVKDREATLIQLERALALEEKTGNRPTHKLEKGLLPNPVAGVVGNSEEVDSIEFYTNKLMEENKKITKQIDYLKERANEDTIIEDENLGTTSVRGQEGGNRDLLTFVKSGTTEVAKTAAMRTASLTYGATNLVAKTALDAKKLVVPGEDGELFSAGFVSFSTLRTAGAALQQLHHERPFAMEVSLQICRLLRNDIIHLCFSSLLSCLLGSRSARP